MKWWAQNLNARYFIYDIILPSGVYKPLGTLGFVSPKHLEGWCNFCYVSMLLHCLSKLMCANVLFHLLQLLETFLPSSLILLHDDAMFLLQFMHFKLERFWKWWIQITFKSDLTKTLFFKEINKKSLTEINSLNFSKIGTFENWNSWSLNLNALFQRCSPTLTPLYLKFSLLIATPSTTSHFINGLTRIIASTPVSFFSHTLSTSSFLALI